MKEEWLRGVSLFEHNKGFVLSSVWREKSRDIGSFVNEKEEQGGMDALAMLVHERNWSEALKALAVTPTKDVIKWRSKQGNSLLYKAVQRDAPVNFCAELLKCGIDVNHRILANGMTALNWLCYSSARPSLEMIALLIQYGADVNKRGTNGAGPLYHLCRKWWEVRIQTFELLINNGADLNQRTMAGESPLFNLRQAPIEFYRLLLENGASAKFENEKGESVLHVVCKHFVEPEVIKVLIAYGADLFKTDHTVKRYCMLPAQA